MENNHDTLKMDSTSAPTPKTVTLKDVPPRTIFRLARTGTRYMKMPDGSIRNVEKALRRHLKMNKNQFQRAALEASKQIAAEALQTESAN